MEPDDDQEERFRKELLKTLKNPELQEYIEDVRELDDPDALVCALLDLSRAAKEAVEEAQHQREREFAARQDAVRINDLIRLTFKQQREYMERTQESFAADMRRIGFVTWKRITVAEVESGKRRLSWEELVGVASLLGRSVPFFFEPGPYPRMVEINERRVVHQSTLVKALFPRGDVHVYDDKEMADAHRFIAGLHEGDVDWRPASNVRTRKDA